MAPLRLDRTSHSPLPSERASGIPTGQRNCKRRKSRPTIFRSSSGKSLSHSRAGSFPAESVKTRAIGRPYRLTAMNMYHKWYRVRKINRTPAVAAGRHDTRAELQAHPLLCDRGSNRAASARFSLACLCAGQACPRRKLCKDLDGLQNCEADSLGSGGITGGDIAADGLDIAQCGPRIPRFQAHGL